MFIYSCPQSEKPICPGLPWSMSPLFHIDNPRLIADRPLVVTEYSKSSSVYLGNLLLRSIPVIDRRELYELFEYKGTMSILQPETNIHYRP